MAQARIQPLCRAYNINIGFNSGRNYFLELILKEIKHFFKSKSHFCLIGKSKVANFNKAVEEVKSNFKNVDDFIKKVNVNDCFEYIYKPKKVEDQLPILFGYDKETHNDKIDASP